MEKVVCRTLAALVLGTHFAIAAPTQETTQACAAITKALPGKVLTPALLALEYEHEIQQYWSTTLRSVDPACIVQPVSAEDVSVVIKVLNKYPTVNFATRSGGHDPNVGHASVQDGVLITMSDMVGATYDAAKKIAYVKPGGEWNDVVGDLEPSGVTILGGRLGSKTPTFNHQVLVLTSVRHRRRWRATLGWWLVLSLCTGRSGCRQHHRLGDGDGQRLHRQRRCGNPT
jgi:hypothetical protein